MCRTGASATNVQDEIVCIGVATHVGGDLASLLSLLLRLDPIYWPTRHVTITSTVMGLGSDTNRVKRDP